MPVGLPSAFFRWNDIGMDVSRHVTLSLSTAAEIILRIEPFTSWGRRGHCVTTSSRSSGGSSPRASDEGATHRSKNRPSTVSGFCPESVESVSESGFSGSRVAARNVLALLDLCSDSVGIVFNFSPLASTGWIGFGVPQPCSDLQMRRTRDLFTLRLDASCSHPTVEHVKSAAEGPRLRPQFAADRARASVCVLIP